MVNDPEHPLRRDGRRGRWAHGAVGEGARDSAAAREPGTRRGRRGRGRLRGLRWFDHPDGWQLIRRRAADLKSPLQDTAVELLGYNDDPATRDLLLRLLAETSDLADSRYGSGQRPPPLGLRTRWSLITRECAIRKRSGHRRVRHVLAAVAGARRRAAVDGDSAATPRGSGGAGEGHFARPATAAGGGGADRDGWPRRVGRRCGGSPSRPGRCGKFWSGGRGRPVPLVGRVGQGPSGRDAARRGGGASDRPFARSVAHPRLGRQAGSAWPPTR